MDLGLSGRCYLVTGGSSGIGRATVNVLLDEGASVVTCARGEERLGATAAELAAGDGGRRARLLTQVADVGDKTAVAELVSATVGRFGRLDGVVCNAGRGSSGTVASTTARQWHDELDQKVVSVVTTVRAAVAALSASDAGRVVTLGGVTARVPHASMVAVSAARAAAENLTASLARELAPTGILVNCVRLGVIDTGRARDRWRADAGVGAGAGSDGGEEFAAWSRREAARRSILLGRLGTPAEVADVIAFLLSPRASYLTGSVIEVSGGAGLRESDSPPRI